MVRTIKNLFAPINWVPPEVLSLIPDYCDMDDDLIALTHVCRSWREVFTSRASSWTFLDCVDLDKTNVYIQRSRGSPLEICPTGCHHHDALLLTLPLTGRLKALTISGSHFILRLTKHFGSQAPLPEKLDIQVRSARPAPTKGSIFGGNLSSLRELRLYAVLTNLPWENLTNLTTFEFHQVPGVKISVTQLLDFFERAPLLRAIVLVDSLPGSSDAPYKRVVSLPHLRLLRINARQPHSILLNHLHIPIDTLVTLEFKLNHNSTPISHYFPTPLDNLNNISHITSIDLSFNSGVAMRLKGPSGGLRVLGTWINGGSPPPVLDLRLLRSLNEFPISTTETFAITLHDGSADPKTEESGTYQTLLLMSNLRILTLIDCIDLVFVLNPGRNTPNVVVCPKLEELILYVQEGREESCIDGLLEMVKERTSRGVELSTIVVVCRRELIPVEKAFGLRKYVEHVEYRLGDESPERDTVPGEVN